MAIKQEVYRFSFVTSSNNLYAVSLDLIAHKGNAMLIGEDGAVSSSVNIGTERFYFDIDPNAFTNYPLATWFAHMAIYGPTGGTTDQSLDALLVAQEV